MSERNYTQLPEQWLQDMARNGQAKTNEVRLLANECLDLRRRQPADAMAPDPFNLTKFTDALGTLSNATDVTCVSVDPFVFVSMIRNNLLDFDIKGAPSLLGRMVRLTTAYRGPNWPKSKTDLLDKDMNTLCSILSQETTL